MSWAVLRQVVLACLDPETAADELRAALGERESFADPLLADLGLADRTVLVGNGSYLELLTPERDGLPLRGWLRRRGGAGGYALSVQVPDVEGCVRRAEARGVRTVARAEYDGAAIAQLHPADMGLLLELDGVSDPDRWFWDGRVPLASSPRASDIAGVVVAVPDPARTAQLWADVLDLRPPLDTRLAMGTRTVTFASAGDGAVRGLAEVELLGAGPPPPDCRVAGVRVRWGGGEPVVRGEGSSGSSRSPSAAGRRPR